MKKLLLAMILCMAGMNAANAQVIINRTNNASPMAGGIGNMMNRPNNIPAPTNSYPNQAQSADQGFHIKTLEERRQEQFAKQQEQLEKSGIHIQNIQSTQQGTMNLNPNNLPTTPQQIQDLQQQNTVNPDRNSSQPVSRSSHY